MTSLKDVNFKYAAREAISKKGAGIFPHFYADQLLLEYRELLKKLNTNRKEFATDSALFELDIFFRTFRNSMFLEPFAKSQFVESYNRLSQLDIKDLAINEQYQVLKMLLGKTAELLEREKDPGTSEIQKMIAKSDGRNLLTFRRERTAQIAESIFFDLGNSAWIFDCPSRRAPGNFDQNYIFGPLDWFPESLVLQPSAIVTRVISVEGLRLKLPEIQTFAPWMHFGADIPPKLAPSPLMIVAGSTFELEGVPDEIENERFVDWHKYNEATFSSESKTERCKQVALASTDFVFVDLDGERLSMVEVDMSSGRLTAEVQKNPNDIKVGDYIVLRDGVSDQALFRQQVVMFLGKTYSDLEETQLEWKNTLIEFLKKRSAKTVKNELRDLGVRYYDQAQYWALPYVDRPRRESDFLILLQYLELKGEKYLRNANRLRSASQKVRLDFRKELEEAIKQIDPVQLRDEKFILIASKANGVAGIWVSRIDSISPHEVFVEPNRIRVPIRDKEPK